MLITKFSMNRAVNYFIVGIKVVTGDKKKCRFVVDLHKSDVVFTTKVSMHLSYG